MYNKVIFTWFLHSKPMAIEEYMYLSQNKHGSSPQQAVFLANNIPTNEAEGNCQ